MDQTLIFWTIVGMAVVTYLPRLLPALFLSGKTLRPIFASWLRLIPPAVLAAMLVPSLVVRENAVDFGFQNLFFLGSTYRLSCSLEVEKPFCDCGRRDGTGCSWPLFGLGYVTFHECPFVYRKTQSNCPISVAMV